MKLRPLVWILVTVALGCSSASNKSGGNSTGGAGGDGGSSDTGGATGGGGGGSTGGSGGSAGSGGSDTGGSGAGGQPVDAGTPDEGTSTPSDGPSGTGGGGGSSGGHDVLFLSGGKGAIDASLMTGLKAKGFTIMMAADNTPAAMAAGKALVVISSTTSRGNIDPKFKDSPVPIIVMKDGVMKALGMTGADVVTGVGMNKVTMVMGADADLSAGKTGDVTVYSNTDRMFAGQMLGADAKKVATLVGQAMQWAIFAYDKGGMMPGGPAPARRVGFFAHQDGSLSPDGLALFEAAVDWATK
jgi:hypothetical protein